MNHIVKQFLEERNAEFLYEDLIDLLKNNTALRIMINADYERECHEEDVRIELDERGIDYNDDVIQAITTIYEDRLSDLDDWYPLLSGIINMYLKET